MPSIQLTDTNLTSWSPPFAMTITRISCKGGGADGFDSIATLDSVSGGGEGASSRKNVSLEVDEEDSFSLQIGDLEEDTWFNTSSYVMAKGASGKFGGSGLDSIGDDRTAGEDGGDPTGEQ